MSSTPENPRDESVSESIISIIAEEEDVPPVELTPPLYQVVDPDALDALARSAEQNVHVSFTYCSYFVTVSSSGEVVVRPRREDGERSNEGRADPGDAGERPRGESNRRAK